MSEGQCDSDSEIRLNYWPDDPDGVVPGSPAGGAELGVVSGAAGAAPEESFAGGLTGAAGSVEAGSPG